MTEDIDLNNSKGFSKSDYDTAIQNLKRAIDIKFKANGKESLHVCITGLSDPYFEKGEMANSKKACERINNSEQIRIANEISNFERYQ